MNELVAGFITEPCVSSQFFDLAVIATIAAVIALVLAALAWRLLVAANKQLRLADLGVRLLHACAGDWPSAEKAVENVAADNELFDDVVRADLRVKQQIVDGLRRQRFAVPQVRYNSRRDPYEDTQ